MSTSTARNPRRRGSVPVLPPYSPDINTKLTLSVAYSIEHNTRHLEAEYYPCWTSILRDVTAFSNRLIVAGQAPVLLQGLDIRSARLEEKQRSMNALVAKALAAAAHTGGTSRQNDVHAQSAAIAAAKARKSLEMAFEKAERQDIILAGLVAETNSEEPDLSFSHDSIHDGDSRIQYPDSCFHHVVGGTLRMPTTVEGMRSIPAFSSMSDSELQDKLAHLQVQHWHDIRMGVKTVHKCSLLIGELKTAGTRKHANKDIIITDDDRNLEALDDVYHKEHLEKGAPTACSEQTMALLIEAAEEVMFYCAVYFESHSSQKIIALVGAGPVWSWTVVKRSEVPTYNWLTKEIISDGTEQEVFTDT
ncbi:hypothetical protein BXZ70DRAFT_932467 [Cristinia sonorae]|uniref:Uncharacterized protein n=1 Tax=Cristinia sonorae TaxID=1940300 RepID=A0A8K0UQ69_9AGAR|nr:hypothetical protein BXZ70DRAFT_932467 [Cristinia sonorae]